MMIVLWFETKFAFKMDDLSNIQFQVKFLLNLTERMLVHLPIRDNLHVSKNKCWKQRA